MLYSYILNIRIQTVDLFIFIKLELRLMRFITGADTIVIGKYKNVKLTSFRWPNVKKKFHLSPLVTSENHIILQSAFECCQ